jgi:predicted transcriptional regulator
VKSERAILDVLFPKVRAQLLRLLLDVPQKQRYVRELMRMSGLALSTVQDELRKLSEIGLVSSWSNRYHRFFLVNRDHPLFPDLLHIVQMSERLPLAKRAPLRRQQGRHLRKDRRRRKVTTLRHAHPLSWHLFSREKKPSRK